MINKLKRYQVNKIKKDNIKKKYPKLYNIVKP